MEDFFYRFLSLFNRLPLPVRQGLGWIYRAFPAGVKYGRFYSLYRSRLDYFRLLKTDEEAAEAQGRFLLEQVNQAIENIPYYRDYRKLSSAADILHYPVIGKRTISEHFDDFLNPALSGKRIRANTGGSSGTPLEFFIEKGVTRPKEKSHFDWYWQQFGYEPNSRILMVRGVPLAGNRTFEYRTIDNVLSVSCYNINETNIRPVVEAVRKFSPGSFMHTLHPLRCLPRFLNLTAMKSIFRCRPCSSVPNS